MIEEINFPSSASGSQEIEDFLGVALQVQQHGVRFARSAHSSGLKTVNENHKWYLSTVIFSVCFHEKPNFLEDLGLFAENLTPPKNRGFEHIKFFKKPVCAFEINFFSYLSRKGRPAAGEYAGPLK